ncbi:MAG: hypothetical protein Q9170_003294 [Blastenia crenularia]
MHIFQESEQCFSKLTERYETSLSKTIKRERSEESIRTEFCDGPLFDASPSEVVENVVDAPQQDVPKCGRNEVCTSDRNELMERIKRGESPTWVPSQSLQEEYSKHNGSRSFSPPPTSAADGTAPLLPAAPIDENSATSSGRYATELSPPSEIKRPSSALHAGDFNKDSLDASTNVQPSPVLDKHAAFGAQYISGTSPTIPWDTSSRSFDNSPSPSPSSGRSICYSLQASSSAQQPTFLRSRRQSHASEASPLQSASMVGSYEESILRGWMSTAPSKPLDFTAQIGVLGKASCKPKCPAHVTITFPAVYYSWTAGVGRKHSDSDAEPSPYVGHIDLQHLPTPAESKRTRRSRSKSPKEDASSSISIQGTVADTSTVEPGQSMRRQKKRRRTSPAAPDLQGGYRIPQTGQLQIVIKNPNKTAVKLFLVPYDLKDMQAGTKTFIRQRCYSTDPVVDGLSAKSTSEPNLSAELNQVKSKPTLRYLIHVNICSPSNGRFYLYQHIRVVFANRVPDNKEQLQTEIQVPQPRYSAYKPHFSLSRSISSSGANFARERAHRRRTGDFGVGLDGADDRHPRAFVGEKNDSFIFGLPSHPPVPDIPLHLAETGATASDISPLMDFTYTVGKGHPPGNRDNLPYPVYEKAPGSPTPASLFQQLSVSKQRPRANDCCQNPQFTADDQAKDIDRSTYRSIISPFRDRTNCHILQSRSSDLNVSGGEGIDTYGKLNKGDAGYGGRPSTPKSGGGLLARKLKGALEQLGGGENSR